MANDSIREMKRSGCDAAFVTLDIGMNATVLNALREIVEISSHYENERQNFPDELAVANHIVETAFQVILPHLLSLARDHHTTNRKDKNENEGQANHG